LITIKQAIVVEGKYDKIKLSSIVDAVIIQTNGYGIFKDKEKLALIRHYAEKTGIIILTDSDSAGFKIRNYLKGAVDKKKITNVYIPDIFGKEKRKDKASCEGKLGVEGIEKKIILQSFAKAGVAIEECEKREQITRMDFYEFGLTGGQNSSELRKKLLKRLELPELLTSTGLLEIVNTILEPEELKKIIAEIKGES
jgi:ribonuclease M5